jgi:hypothetical protein
VYWRKSIIEMIHPDDLHRLMVSRDVLRQQWME